MNKIPRSHIKINKIPRNHIKINKVPSNKPTWRDKRPALWKAIRHWWKKPKKTQTDGKIYHSLGSEESILSKWLYYPRQSTDSVQSLSDCQWHSSQNWNKIFWNLCGKTKDLWGECGEKGTLLRCGWECKLVQSLWKTVWGFLRKLNIELLYDPAIPLLGTYLDKTFIQKYTCTPMFLAAPFAIAKTWKKL